MPPSFGHELKLMLLLFVHVGDNNAVAFDSVDVEDVNYENDNYDDDSRLEQLTMTITIEIEAIAITTNAT